MRALRTKKLNNTPLNNVFLSPSPQASKKTNAAAMFTGARQQPKEK